MSSFREQALTESLLKTLVSFLQILHAGRLGWDGQYFFTEDNTSIGEQNIQRLCEQFDSVQHEPTLQDIVDVWTRLRKSGQLLYMRPLPSVEQPGTPTQPGEMDIVAKEIALMQRDRKAAGVIDKRNYAKDDTRINPDALLAEKARQAAKDQQDAREFQEALDFAANFNFNGQVSITTLNAKRAELIEQVRKTWVAKRPDRKEDIEAKANAALPGQTTSLQRLPLDCSNSVRRAATKEQLVDLRRREQARDRSAAEALQQ